MNKFISRIAFHKTLTRCFFAALLVLGCVCGYFGVMQQHEVAYAAPPIIEVPEDRGEPIIIIEEQPQTPSEYDFELIDPTTGQTIRGWFA